MDTHHAQRVGWYLAWLGSSAWMFGFVVSCLAARLWGEGLGALTAATLNLALVVYLDPWRHPHVPFWKLGLPLISFQVVMISAALFVFEPHDASSRYLPYQMSFFLIVILFARRGLTVGTEKPKPTANAVDGLE